MNLYLSRHARRQMKWRSVSEEEIYEVLKFPDELQESIKGRKKARKKVGEKKVEVVFKEENGRIVIITVIDKTR